MGSPIAILCSMEQEIRLISDRILDRKTHDIRGQLFTTGSLGNRTVVAAISGYGKTGAAATAAIAIAHFGATAVIFGGVAGGIHREVRIGDVVVASHLIHHDFDASPLFAPTVVPSLGIARIPTDPDLSDRLHAAAEAYLRDRAPTEVQITDPGLFPVEAMTLHRGLIGSGDQFVSSQTEADSLRQRVPELLAVEMEGAAVAQVCLERDTPAVVFRSISDRADHDADIDFLAFVSGVAAPITAGIVEGWLSRLD